MHQPTRQGSRQPGRVVTRQGLAPANRLAPNGPLAFRAPPPRNSRQRAPLGGGCERGRRSGRAVADRKGGRRVPQPQRFFRTRRELAAGSKERRLASRAARQRVCRARRKTSRVGGTTPAAGRWWACAERHTAATVASLVRRSSSRSASTALAPALHASPADAVARRPCVVSPFTTKVASQR